MCYAWSQVVWSYSMEEHFRTAHGGKEMPGKLAEATVLGVHEEAHVKQLLKVYVRGIKNVCPTCTGMYKGNLKNCKCKS